MKRYSINAYLGLAFKTTLFLMYGFVMSYLSLLVMLPNHEAIRAYPSTGIGACLLFSGIVAGLFLSFFGVALGLQLMVETYKKHNKEGAFQYLNHAIYLMTMVYAPFFLMQHHETIRLTFYPWVWFCFIGLYLLAGLACYLSVELRLERLRQSRNLCVSEVRINQ
jgi:hypothetical protein